ncbi:MAG: uroporphyrinogen-III C-methyltransferase [Cytophagaceae bacterium]|nr:uroporphyrinogen-III C-methyltransferase [Cytophagaceae bacterium]
MSIHPKLSLVGAGPGDPELITLKGLKVLAVADVVLYDALIDKSILEHAPATALKIFVGKQKGVCQFPQEKINELIVQYAQSHGHVVRLKGGDPFIFGRGHEELTVAKQHNIEVQVVPGVSSAVSVAGLQEIPLTRRGINDSFWVMTGTTKDHKLSRDIYHAAQSDATAVILMGMSQLESICDVFTKFGKSNTSVAIIQNGTLPTEKVLIGKVEDIVAKVAESKIGSPAIIIIGEVVNLHPSIWKEKSLCISFEQ